MDSSDTRRSHTRTASVGESWASASEHATASLSEPSRVCKILQDFPGEASKQGINGDSAGRKSLKRNDRALSGVALEAGIIVGSGFDAGFQTIIGNCK